MLRHALICVGLAPVFACGARVAPDASSVTDADDETGTDTGDTTGDDTGDDTGDGDGTEPICPDTHVCVPPPPSPWQGPFVLAPNDDDTSCPDAYPGALVLGEVPADEDVSCECSCEPLDFDCGPLRITHAYKAGVDCGGFGNLETIDDPDTCTPVDHGPHTQLSTKFIVDLDEVDCAPELVEQRPEPAWAVSWRLCQGAADALGCMDDAACLPKAPEGFAGGHCVVLDAGGQECPAAYPNQRVLYAKIDDQRTCTACECDGVETASCSAKVELASDDECVEHVQPVVETNECVKDTSEVTHLRWWGQQAEATCNAPTGGQPTGGLVGDPDSAHTVCCRD